MVEPLYCRPRRPAPTTAYYISKRESGLEDTTTWVGEPLLLNSASTPRSLSAWICPPITSNGQLRLPVDYYTTTTTYELLQLLPPTTTTRFEELLPLASPSGQSATLDQLHLHLLGLSALAAARHQSSFAPTLVQSGAATFYRLAS
jgi:hypothetical protein